MQASNKRSLGNWLSFLSQTEIPVLKGTGERLTALLEDEERMSARMVARIVLGDPLLTVKLLHYLQLHRPSHQYTEIIQVEQAILMLGLKKFYAQVSFLPVVEDLLEPHPWALIELGPVLERAARAADYAIEWAVRLNDLRFHEVYVAALLHDVAEILLWCFAPKDMLAIRERQIQDRTLRSQAVQEEVLGFPISELQRLLAKEWSLPKLLTTLMDDSLQRQSRVRNVTLAVNLARHSANGWDDAALPDDFRNIAALLHLPLDQVKDLVRATPIYQHPHDSEE